MYLVGALEGF